jgi:hypothetical protein
MLLATPVDADLSCPPRIWDGGWVQSILMHKTQMAVGFLFLSVMEGKSFAWKRESKRVHKNFHCHISKKMTFYILSSPTHDDKVVFFLSEESLNYSFYKVVLIYASVLNSEIFSASCNLSHWKLIVAEIYCLVLLWLPLIVWLVRNKEIMNIISILFWFIDRILLDITESSCCVPRTFYWPTRFRQKVSLALNYSYLQTFVFPLRTDFNSRVAFPCIHKHWIFIRKFYSKLLFILFLKLTFRNKYYYALFLQFSSRLSFYLLKMRR